MSAVYFDASLTDEQRRQELYAGGLFVCSATPASQAMVELAQQMLEEAFAPYDPRTVHNHLSAEQVAAILGTLKPRFVHHPECKALIRQLMVENGVDIERTYFDVPRMRSAYPSDFLSSGIAYAFHAHRDTWYSAPLNQINWWFPIYPIEAGNSMAFYPYYFDRPVKNNSEIYNYYEWNSKHRATAAQHVKTDTREQPKPQQDIEPPASLPATQARQRDHVLRRAVARDGPEYDRAGAIQHRFPDRKSSTTRSHIAGRPIRIRAAPARPCATICALPICSTFRRKSFEPTTTGQRPSKRSLLRRSPCCGRCPRRQGLSLARECPAAREYDENLPAFV